MPMSGFMDDDPIRDNLAGDPAPGLEGVPRADMAVLETAVPELVDAILRGPVVLTRHGREAFVLLPLDVWRRVWNSTRRAPVIQDRPAKD
jgi:hypothetical protein